MDETSPYLPPATPSLPPLPPPSAVKVFGIMHLVLAGLGLLTGIWGLVSKLVMAMVQGASPDDPTVVIQRKYMEELWPITIMGSIFALGLAGLLAVAGIKLVRLKPDGIMWSNRYAWTSIVTKVISLVVTVGYVLPLTNRMMGEITHGLPAATGDKMAGIMKTVTAISSVASPLISCIYPALALFFLSRPAVKNWAANTR